MKAKREPAMLHVAAETPEGIRQWLDMLLKAQEPNRALHPEIRHTPASLLDQYGRLYRLTSESLAGERMPLGHCYRNAAITAMWEGRDLQYVEGWVYWAGITIDHAWCADPRGNVVDPTMPPFPVEPDEEAIEPVYFGIPFDHLYLADCMEQTEHWGVMGLHNMSLFRGEHDGIFLARP